MLKDSLKNKLSPTVNNTFEDSPVLYSISNKTHITFFPHAPSLIEYPSDQHHLASYF